VIVCAGAGVAGAREDRVVADAANRFNQLVGRCHGRIEDDVGAVGDEIDVRGFNARGRAQRFLHVMLA
jgi:hypothetical protein